MITLENGMQLKFFCGKMYMFEGYVKGKSKNVVNTSQGKFRILDDGTWQEVKSGNHYNVYVLCGMDIK